MRGRGTGDGRRGPAIFCRLVPVLCHLLFAAALQAHDFWIEPSTFHPAHGMTVSVGLRVGQNFVGDPVPRVGAYIERFVVKQGRQEEEISGAESADPAGWFTADGRGPAVIAYASKPSRVELA